MPHILITNDDGIYAEGLRALVTAFAGIGTVSVVAPISERSAAAQSLTLRHPIFCEQVAERDQHVDGPVGQPEDQDLDEEGEAAAEHPLADHDKHDAEGEEQEKRAKTAIGNRPSSL